MASKVKKIIKVPSKSEPDKQRKVEILENGRMRCNCIAGLMNKECRHIKIVKWHKGYIQGNPEKCFYSGYTQHLEEHHLLRAANRPYSLTVFITRWVHSLATYNKDFEKHLTNLFLKTMEKIRQAKTTATVKDGSMRNLASGDKGLRIVLHSSDIENAAQFSRIPGDHLVKVIYPGGEMYAMVSAANKKNFKSDSKENRIEITLEAMPGEFVNWVKVIALDHSKEIELKYNRDWQN